MKGLAAQNRLKVNVPRKHLSMKLSRSLLRKKLLEIDDIWIVMEIF